MIDHDEMNMIISSPEINDLTYWPKHRNLADDCERNTKYISMMR